MEKLIVGFVAGAMVAFVTSAISQPVQNNVVCHIEDTQMRWFFQQFYNARVGLMPTEPNARP